MADITITAARKSYGKTQTLHGIDLAFASGEFVVILGPSGCGKSTLLRMIAGLEEITSGEIAINGRVVNRLEPRERGCAMVFQNYALYPHMTVADNIGYALKVAGVPKAERRVRIAETAAIVGLSDYLERKPAALSGGQRQRVAMARAIIREPKVFLFDEPLSNLDATLRVSMRAEIRKLHQRLSATSVFVTHDQVEAMTLADKLVVMNKGHVEQVGPPLDIYHRPASVFVASFIGAPPMNLIDIQPDPVLPIARHAHLAIPVPPSLVSALAGGAATLGIRPEECRVLPMGQGLPARVDFVEELGSGRVVHMIFGTTPFAAVIAPDLKVAPGDMVGLDLPQSQLHVFDRETGRRLAIDPAVGRRETAPQTAEAALS